MIWSPAGKSRRIAREAARWRTEMEEPASDIQIEAFEAWLKKDPAHLKAYQQSDRIAELGAGLPSQSRELRRPASAARRYRPAFAIAATVVFALGIWTLVRDPAPAYAAVSNAGQATRSVTLGDGSIVTLDTATMLEVAVAPPAHHVKMSSGRARFAVHNAAATPLRVTVLGGEVASANGVFDVAIGDHDVRIWIVSGEAAVAVPAAKRADVSRRLIAGQGVRLQSGEPVAQAIGGWDTNWPDAHVAFEQTPLANLLARANRNRMPKISVAEDQLGELRVTGIMDLRDTRRLARKLAAALDLKLTEENDLLLLSH